MPLEEGITPCISAQTFLAKGRSYLLKIVRCGQSADLKDWTDLTLHARRSHASASREDK